MTCGASLNIAWIKKSIEGNDYFISKHADDERNNENLSLGEIEDALLSGKIIEKYTEDKRGESCLVAGFTAKGVPVHAVCGKRGTVLVLITVYIPKPPKFKNIYERG